jgi:DNA-directed RNA polymerase specialized sigma24 family protein
MNRLELDDNYRDCKAILYHTVIRFKRRYGGDLDDLVSEANEAFLRACYSWREEGGASLKTWVRSKVWHALLKARRKQARRHRLLPTVGAAERLLAGLPQPRAFDLPGLLRELSEGAAEAARLAVEPPLDVLLAARRHGRGKRLHAGARRQAVREYLAELGWSVRRINAAFREIREALGD